MVFKNLIILKHLFSQLEAESAQLRELLMMEKGQPSIGEFDDTDTDSGLFPSLMELSMGGGDDGGSQDSNREDLMTMCMQCDADGDYGLVLRHFTVLAAVPVRMFYRYS